ncbi:NYN domain-containing protein [Pullulanibacillus sp. KACC 23026]|uniref:NYN domain-containing protein n=1 Tax=Pullulanibacillus sp. KACC 23026 TaxID=3028315 RepID=UPI0023B1B28E|nr:NYN domain-containing protein [Pullulanibacillus sp. KACC 23026]WEG12689.1 NYN domain-containing protein [Pullulanibacillus sp. KACC 23026]
MDVLLVDGYNIIGAWRELSELKNHDFHAARERLIDELSEYQAYKGWRLIVVFDAHLSQGIEKKAKQSRVEVIYTKEKETADERIEKLVSHYKNVKTNVYVATSDLMEQWTIFTQGALRISARELITEISQIKKQIASKVIETNNVKQRGTIPLSKEISDHFERLRRGK